MNFLNSSKTQTHIHRQHAGPAQARLLQTVSCELLDWVEAFLVDRQAQNVAAGTLLFYQSKLRIFQNYCQTQAVSEIGQIDETLIRRFLFHLKETGHNPGGSHAVFRAIRAFMNWYANEADPEGWRNPMLKVRAPKVPIEPIEPVALNDVLKMVRSCNLQTFHGARDHAILLTLLDTGTRAAEFLRIDLEDINLIHRAILIRRGKGSKPRTVFLGARSCKAIRQYLKCREDPGNALWVTGSGERLSYDGLRATLARRAEAAGLPESPNAHDFRRAFALAMLRAGTDVFTLSKLMGHSNIMVLQRYLKQTYKDTELAHRQGGPVDRL